MIRQVCVCACLSFFTPLYPHLLLLKIKLWMLSCVLKIASLLTHRVSLVVSTWPFSRFKVPGQRVTYFVLTPSPRSPSDPATSGTGMTNPWTHTRNRTWNGTETATHTHVALSHTHTHTQSRIVVVVTHRMRTRWNEAVLNRRDYLDTEVRKLMEKREPSVSDLEKQNELLDQWAMLQWQRQAVLQPKPGSGVPGAPTNWSVTGFIPDGFELGV